MSHLGGSRGAVAVPGSCRKLLTVIGLCNLFRSGHTLAVGLLSLWCVMRGKETSAMLGSLLKHLSVPHLPMRAVASAGVVSSFVWLLAHDLIHPLVIYLLELYLTF